MDQNFDRIMRSILTAEQFLTLANGRMTASLIELAPAALDRFWSDLSVPERIKIYPYMWEASFPNDAEVYDWPEMAVRLMATYLPKQYHKDLLEKWFTYLQRKALIFNSNMEEFIFSIEPIFEDVQDLSVYDILEEKLKREAFYPSELEQILKLLPKERASALIEAITSNEAICFTSQGVNRIWSFDDISMMLKLMMQYFVLTDGMINTSKIATLMHEFLSILKKRGVLDALYHSHEPIPDNLHPYIDPSIPEINFSKYVQQTGANCKIVAIANIENIFSEQQNVPSIPLHKNTSLLYENMPVSSQSIRQIAKESGLSTQGEILNINQMYVLLEALEYQHQTLDLYQTNLDDFKRSITKKIDQGYMVITFFVIDYDKTSNIWIVSEQFREIPNIGFNDHAAVIIGYERDNVVMVHHGKIHPVSFEKLYNSTHAIPKEMKSETYQRIPLNPYRKYQLTRWALKNNTDSGMTAKLICVRPSPGYLEKRASLKSLLQISDIHDIQRIEVSVVDYFLNISPEDLPIPYEYKQSILTTLTEAVTLKIESYSTQLKNKIKSRHQSIANLFCLLDENIENLDQNKLDHIQLMLKHYFPPYAFHLSRSIKTINLPAKSLGQYREWLLSLKQYGPVSASRYSQINQICQSVKASHKNASPVFTMLNHIGISLNGTVLELSQSLMTYLMSKSIDFSLFYHIASDFSASCVYEAEGYSAYHLYHYLNHYINTEWGQDHVTTRPKLQKALHSLKKPLLLMIEIANELQSIRAFYTKQPYHSSDKNDDRTISSSVDTYNPFSSFRQRILNRISDLSAGEQLVLPSGWHNLGEKSGHAILYQFQKDSASNQLIFQIYESSFFVGHESFSTSTEKRVYPVQTYYIPIPFDCTHFEIFLNTLLIPYIAGHPLRLKMRINYTIDVLYQDIFKALCFLRGKPVAIDEIPYLQRLTTKGQITGNCAQKSTQQWLKINIKNLVDYDYFMLKYKIHAINKFIASKTLNSSDIRSIVLSVENCLKMIQILDMGLSDRERDSLIQWLVQIKGTYKSHQDTVSSYQEVDLDIQHETTPPTEKIYKIFDQFESKKYFVVYYDEATGQGTIHFRRYALRLNLLGTNQIRLNLNNKDWYLIQTPSLYLKTQVAHLVFSSVDEPQQTMCLIPIQAFYNDESKHKQGNYLHYTHDINQSIDHSQLNQSTVHEKIESYAYFMVRNNELIPTTFEHALYLCYIYLATHEYDKANEMVAYLQDHLPIQGDPDEERILSWIVSQERQEHPCSTKYYPVCLKKTPHTVAVQLKLLALFCESNLSRKTFINQNGLASTILLYLKCYFNMEKYLNVHYKLDTYHTYTLFNFISPYLEQDKKLVGVLGYQYVKTLYPIWYREQQALISEMQIPSDDSRTQVLSERLNELHDLLQIKVYSSRKHLVERRVDVLTNHGTKPFFLNLVSKEGLVACPEWLDHGVLFHSSHHSHAIEKINATCTHDDLIYLMPSLFYIAIYGNDQEKIDLKIRLKLCLQSALPQHYSEGDSEADMCSIIHILLALIDGSRQTQLCPHLNNICQIVSEVQTGDESYTTYAIESSLEEAHIDTSSLIKDENAFMQMQTPIPLPDTNMANKDYVPLVVNDQIAWKNLILFSNSNLNTHYALSLASGLLRPVTQTDLIACYMEGNVYHYNRCTKLSEEDCVKLHQQIHHLIKKKLGTSDTHPQHPILMGFQYRSGFILNPTQIHMLMKLSQSMDDVKRVKTSAKELRVILPLLVKMRANGKRLIIVDVSEQFLKTHYNALYRISHAYLQQHLLRLEFAEDSRYTLYQLEHLYRTLVTTMTQRGYVVTTGQSWRTLAIAASSSNNDQTTSVLGKINRFFKCQAEIIVGEVLRKPSPETPAIHDISENAAARSNSLRLFSDKYVASKQENNSEDFSFQL